MKTNETPTPETDAEEAHKFEALEFITPAEWEWVVPADFARRLERERDEAREYADKLVAHKDMVCLPKDLDVLREANLGLAMELNEARALADRLADALKFIITDNIANAADMRYRANKALTEWKEVRK